MAENKKYYYLKLKEDFFDSEDIKVIESMENGYLYSNILLKMYLKSLKHNGGLIFREFIPYDIKMLSTVTGHNIDIVEKALRIFKSLGFIDILDNGTIYMLDVQKYIGSISTEGQRKAEYRQKIKEEKKLLLEANGTMSQDCPNIISISNYNSNSNISNINTNTQEIFDYWNSKEIVVHKTLTQTFIKAIDKALKKYSVEEIKKYIDRYNTVLKDITYFFDTKWTIDKFLTQSNAIADFTDEGSKWLSYLNRQEKTIQPKTAIHFENEREYSKEELNSLLTDIDNIDF